jgi:hypothetical protein
LYSVQPETPPPGLTQEPFSSKSQWQAFWSEDNEEISDAEQKAKDMREMEANYHDEYPKATMSNYSKSSVRRCENTPKPKFRPIDKTAKKSLNIFEKVPIRKDLNPVTRPVVPSPNEQGWRKMKSVMDSGANESVAHPGHNPDYPVVPSPGSLIGQKYVSASGDDIENEGEQVLEVVTMQGVPMKQKYQSAQVHRPLNSISEICDAGGASGQFVLFSKWGGIVLNPENGRRVPFDREDGIYTMGMWVRPKSAHRRTTSGFTRPGRRGMKHRGVILLPELL